MLTIFERRVGAIEAPASEPRLVSEVIRRNNMAIVRELLTPEAERHGRELAAGLVASGNPGDNLVKLTSAGEETGFELVRSVLSARLVAIAAEYFTRVAGTPNFLLPYINLLVRHFDARLSRPGTMIPFHQDAFAFPRGFAVLNCWTLLHPDECGETSPGLDFMPIALRGMLAKESKPASAEYGFLETSHRRLADLERRHEPITPSVRLGDVLIFNQLALHRTSLRTGFQHSRVSAEIRLIAATRQAMRERQILGEAYAQVSGGVIRWPDRWRLSADGKFRPMSHKEAPIGVTG